MQKNFLNKAGRTAWVGVASLSVALLMLPSAAFADFAHEIRDGDTLWDIAVKYDVSLTELLGKNGLSENDVLSIGKGLTIPSEFDFDYTLVTDHKVAGGECLSVIAVNYGVTVKAICAFNGLGEDDALYVGQVLSIPPQGKEMAVSRTVDGDSYIVHPGDSAWLIARRHNVSVADLLRANGLGEDSIITVGQKLVIPGFSDTPVDRGLGIKSYTVRPGECWSTIAEKFEIATVDLCEMNGMKADDIIKAGQKLRVPSRSTATPDKPAETRAPMVVDPGELNPDAGSGGPLPPINVPVVNSPEGGSVFDYTSTKGEFSYNGYYDGGSTYYVIQPGDCLSYVADCFGLSVKEICEASNLTNADYIINGQVIKLPGKHDISKLKKYAEENISSGGQKLVDACMESLGVKYVYGGTDLKHGMDCSGLIWAIVRRDYDITLPRSAKDLSETSYGVEIDYDALKAGDLVFFHTTRPGISHVGVYMGNGKFVHATSAKGKVDVGRMDQGYYKERFIKALRLNFL